MPINWQQVIKANIPQMLLVFVSFFLMVLVSYFSISSIIQQRLLIDMDEAIRAAEANVKTGFYGADVTITNAAGIVQEMLDNGASKQTLLEYLTNTTRWMEKNNSWNAGIYGIYGYIRGEFLDGLPFSPGPDFKFHERPWFDAGMKNPGETTVFTDPYLDARTGEVIISAVRNLYGKGGENYGMLTIDMDLSWLENHIQYSDSPDGRYGVILDRNMIVVGHPRSEIVGHPLWDIGEGYRKLHDALMKHREITTMQITDVDGSKAIASFKEMSSGWYIGVITPYNSYYRNIYYMAGVLSALGFVFMSILNFFLLHLSAAHMSSDEENRSKTLFLTRMSHEIRTPMNAVIGLSRLGLRTDSLQLAAEYFISIQQAGQNLLSIINDILDFSRIASGHTEIKPSRYMLASLLNDVITITRVRLAEKPILFVVNVESTIPGWLVGDVTRVRQVLLNVLANAAKYTFEGFVMFTVTGEWVNSTPKVRPEMAGFAPDKRSGASILLKFKISDSGIGIKPEDIEHLFGDFVRLDIVHNRGVEGTGLGLAIARRLCQAMGGDITVSSVYDEGSVFTVAIPQQVDDVAPLAIVRDAKEKSVLFHEARSLYANSIRLTLDDLGVGAVMASSEEDFFAQLESGKFTFAFVSPQTVERARSIVNSGNLETHLILLAELEETAHQDVPTVILPAHAVPLASVLNYEAPTVVGMTDPLCAPFASFTAPDAQVLVVDDVPLNLVVAKGFLASYMVKVDVCESGEEAVSLFRKNDYDLVLMDHMMPGMDGVEATALMRGMKKRRETPIIALTANAVAGMREMFLQKDMNDFLSKPIDPSKLDAILRKWIPKEYQRPISAKEAAREVPQEVTSFGIEGLDEKKGVAVAGGTEAVYRKVLALYCRDVQTRMEFLNAAQAEMDMKNFTTQVHALKSASANIGAVALSDEAAWLEEAARCSDISFIQGHIEAFRGNLSILAERIGSALATRERMDEGAENAGELPDDEVMPLLSELKEVFLTENVRRSDEILTTLSTMQLSSRIARIVSEVSDLALTSEFAKAAARLDDLTPT
ncbi:MAG: response regulator [Candidatus Accumulibacter sp.]|nr:response regulator [Accumulibacter sp.]